MSRNRSRGELFEQYPAQVKRTSPAGVHSPRKNLINPSVSNQLHRTPVALAVSADGERTLCPVDAGDVPMSLSTTNPFANEQEGQNDADSSAEEVLQSNPSKRRRAYQPRRRKFVAKEHRKSSNYMLTQRHSARLSDIARRSASSQTIPVCRCAGDPGTSTRELLAIGPLCAVGENSPADMKPRCTDSLFAQYMPENLKICTTYLIMIILIFGTISIILDEEVLGDFFRIAVNYVRSFNWWQNRKKPQTNFEKCLEYVTNFLE